MAPVLLSIIVLLVSATPFLESTLIIPIGILAGLNVWSVMIVSISGNLFTFILAVILAEKLQKWWIERRKNKKKSKGDKTEKASKLWNKYGLPGLAIIHPVTIGSSHATALIAISLGASKKAVTLWIGGSIIVWAIAFAFVLWSRVHIFSNRFRWIPK